MPLAMNSSVDGKTGRLHLAGELDGNSAPAVREEVDRMMNQKLDRLVLAVEDLNFMASAGLRIIIFAKQRNPGLKIYVVKPQPTVVETLKKTGFYDAVYIQQTEPGTEASAS
jgi:anti-anti-sigma factor